MALFLSDIFVVAKVCRRNYEKRERESFCRRVNNDLFYFGYVLLLKQDDCVLFEGAHVFVCFFILEAAVK